MSVPEACRATHWLLVLKLAVAATMNVPLMKSVTLLLAVASLERNVKPFVIQAIVPEELIVLLGTTERLVHVDIP